MNIKEIIQLVVFTGFILFVVLPLAGAILWLLNSPEATTGDALNLFANAAVPWWAGLAEAAPLLFVVIIGILVWANADGVLG